MLEDGLLDGELLEEAEAELLEDGERLELLLGEFDGLLELDGDKLWLGEREGLLLELGLRDGD